jgi:hypothetical protein
MLAAGIELTRAQCRALLDAGAPGLHLYTRNRWTEVAAVLDALDLGERRRATDHRVDSCSIAEMR